MPPHCPVAPCEGCGRIRPCRPVDDQWRCVDCNPTVDAEGNPLEVSAP